MGKGEKCKSRRKISESEKSEKNIAVQNGLGEKTVVAATNSLVENMLCDSISPFRPNP